MFRSSRRTLLAVTAIAVLLIVAVAALASDLVPFGSSETDDDPEGPQRVLFRDLGMT